MRMVGEYMETVSQANKLAEVIRAYWRRRGLFPAIDLQKHGELWCIRSNMVGGFPCKS